MAKTQLVGGANLSASASAKASASSKVKMTNPSKTKFGIFQFNKEVQQTTNNYNIVSSDAPVGPVPPPKPVKRPSSEHNRVRNHERAGMYVLSGLILEARVVTLFLKNSLNS